MADGTETVDVIFQKATCVACHTIPGIPGAKGTIGPVLEEGTNALLRMKDKEYKGTAKTVPDYIMESIVSPSTYVVKPFPDNTDAENIWPEVERRSYEKDRRLSVAGEGGFAATEDFMIVAIYLFCRVNGVHR